MALDLQSNRQLLSELADQMWANEQGVKADNGKPLSGMLIDFSRALERVMEIGTFGAQKYSRGNWLLVEDAEQRYWDAMWRHLLAAGRELNDPESGMDHLHHAAWNILAVIELQQRKDTV